MKTIMGDRSPSVVVRESHGTTTARLRAGPFTASIQAHGAETRLPRHAHASANVTLVLRGEIRESLCRRELACRPGTLFFRAPEEAHSNRYGATGSESLIIDVPRVAYAACASAQPLYEASEVVCGAPARIGLRIVQELGQPDDCTALAVEGLILDLLATSLRARNHRCHRDNETPHVARAMEYLHAHRASTLSLAGLTAASGTSAVRLVRAFRRRFGVTPAMMQRRLRVEWVAEELLRSDKRIARLAVETGFTDQSHLTRVFRRHFGMTPGAYRKRANGS